MNLHRLIVLLKRTQYIRMPKENNGQTSERRKFMKGKFSFRFKLPIPVIIFVLLVLFVDGERT